MAAMLTLAAGVLQFVPPTAAGADPVSKNIAGTCTGADAATNGLLGALGGTSLAVAFKVDGDVPASLKPGQSGSQIKFTWSVTLDAALVGKAVAAGLTKMTIKDAKLDMDVAGPTSTRTVPGRPDDIVLNLVAGQPASLKQGPFTGTLKDVGDSGVITYKTSAVSFTIGVALAGKALNLNIACKAPALVASTPIKVAGAPDLKPIEVPGTAGQPVTIDVVGKYAKAGRTPLLPSSLKALDANGKVVNGKLVVTAGKAGSTTSANFELCGQPFKVSDAEPGVSEVQKLVLDFNYDGFKRGMAFTLKSGDEETNLLWTAKLNFFGALGGLTLPDKVPTGPGGAPAPEWWPNEANRYATGTEYQPLTAAQLQAALELLPSIGPGNVEVTKPVQAVQEYVLTFKGALANKDVPTVGVGTFLSVLPQETKDQLIGLAGSLGGGGGSGGTGGTGGSSTSIPAGLTGDQYIQLLQQQAGELLAAGDFNGAGDKLAESIRVAINNALGSIDVNEAVATINGLFPAKPQVSTETGGEEPVEAKFQDLCSQSSATVVVKAAPVPTTTTVVDDTPPPGPPGPGVLGTEQVNSGGSARVASNGTGPTSLASTGNSASVALLLTAVLLVIAGIVLGDANRFKVGFRTVRR